MAAPKAMTPKARAAFEIYRDLGPGPHGRTLKKVAELLGRRSIEGLSVWSRKYEWGRLCAEHDHASLREALGQREIVRERGQQRLIDYIDEAISVLHRVMTDGRQLPILDRNGEQILGPDGEPLYRPLVRASTQANCAEKILGIAGLVPVKRMETVDRTGESLDAAAAVLRSMTNKQVDALSALLDEDDA
jgi:hypothetical protein